MLFDQMLNMAQYGPFRSSVTRCDDKDAFCISSSFAIIAVPKACNIFSRTRSQLRFANHSIINMGPVEYKRDAATQAYQVNLLKIDGQQGLVIGYAPYKGVVFVLSDARQSPDLVSIFELQARKGQLQTAFDSHLDRPMVLDGPDNMFACVHGASK